MRAQFTFLKSLNSLTARGSRARVRALHARNVSKNIVNLKFGFPWLDRLVRGNS